MADTQTTLRRNADRLPAAALRDHEIAHETARLGRLWDEMRADDEDGRGGSPGEWLIERLGELETEQGRRADGR